MKRCPDCAELVQPTARICRYCRYEFEEPDVLAGAWQKLNAGNTKGALDDAFEVLRVSTDPEEPTDLKLFASVVLQRTPEGEDRMRADILWSRVTSDPPPSLRSGATATATSAAGPTSFDRQPWWVWGMGLSALLICVGSVGPWASVLFISVGGLKGDGQITLVAGLVAIALTFGYMRSSQPAGWALVVIFLAGLVAGGAGAYDWANLQHVISAAEDSENVFATSISVQWGLVLTTLAGFGCAAAAALTHYWGDGESVTNP